jgi:hypothetical protein
MGAVAIAAALTTLNQEAKMAILKKTITGVPDGEIYPREIKAGSDCPENLVAYAQSIGALPKSAKADGGDTTPAQEPEKAATELETPAQ